MECPCSADSFGNLSCEGDILPACIVWGTLRDVYVERQHIKEWANISRIQSRQISSIAVLREKNWRLSTAPAYPKSISTRSFQHDGTAAVVPSQFIPSWKLPLILPLSWYVPYLHMAAILLTQTDVFVELPPIAPDPSVTFSQATAC